MRLRLQLVLEPDWPPLAWIARCDNSDPVITVRHGPQAETRQDWLCEAVWDGEFASGDFDLTDLVFGSGIRLRERGVVFVPAGATVDRGTDPPAPDPGGAALRPPPSRCPWHGREDPPTKMTQLASI